MPIICWGNLAKSADNTQRIEQSIQDYVSGHDENVNAHQIEGSALYMHRVNSLLDHLFGSVDLKHLVSDSILLMTCFESLDGWNISGNTTIAILSTSIYTDEVEDDVARIALYDISLSNLLNFSKNLFFQTTVYFPATTTQDAFFGFGCFDPDPGYDSIGFRIENGSLYAYWTSGHVEHEAVLSGVTLNVRNVYRVYTDVDKQEIYFYVNGVLKYTAEDYYPTNTNAYIFSYLIKTGSSDARFIKITDLFFEIER